MTSNELMTGWPISSPSDYISISGNTSLETLRISFDISKYCNPLPWVISLLAQVGDSNVIRQIRIDLRIERSRVSAEDFTTLPWSGVDEALNHPKFDLVQKFIITVHGETMESIRSNRRMLHDDMHRYLKVLGSVLPMTSRRNAMDIYLLGMSSSNFTSLQMD